MNAVPPSASTPETDSRSGERALVLAAVLTGLLLTYVAYSPRFTSRPLAFQPGEARAYRVDLNRSDRAELMQIPGVGPGKADAIIAERNAGGEFKNVRDLNRVRGIGSKTVDQLEPHVVVDGSTVLPNEPGPAKPLPTPPDQRQSPDEPIDINTATEAEIMRLPGVGRVLAGRIIADRPYSSVDDLLRVKGIGAKTLEKLKAFAVVK